MAPHFVASRYLDSLLGHTWAICKVKFMDVGTRSSIPVLAILTKLVLCQCSSSPRFAAGFLFGKIASALTNERISLN
jgi:hypothetical protein